MDQPRLEPSPWRPLLVWLGPVFGLVNLSIVAIFLTILSIAVSQMFVASTPGGPPAPPPAPSEWQIALTWLWIAVIALVPAQGLLVTLCLTWSPGRFWRRLMTHWLVVLAALTCFVAGYPVFFVMTTLTNGNWAEALDEFWIGKWRIRDITWNEVQQALAFFAALPMVLLGAQTPFWALRLFAGCRLVRTSPGGEDLSVSERDKEALSIGDLLVATALVAVSLALVQFSDRVMTGEGSESLSFMFSTLIIAGVGLVVALVTGVPLVLIFFSRLSLLAAWGVVLALAGVCSSLVFGVSHNLSPSSNPAEQFGGTCLLGHIYTCGVAAGLTVLRSSGWQLARRNVRYSAAH